jgi:hypothetical protein
MFIFVSVNCITRLSCLSDTTEYYFQGTIIKHKRSHKLKHELNIVLVSDILLGFKLKDSTKKLLPPAFLGVSGFQLCDRRKSTYSRFEVFTAVYLKTEIFKQIMPCQVGKQLPTF